MLIVLLFVSGQFIGVANALSSAQQELFGEGINYFNTTDTGGCSDSSVGTPATTVSSSPSSTWSSTVQPPYYLEEFVINVLEDIAQKLNVPQSSAVTQQHVLAMIGWAQAEGGNLVPSDPDAFNIWNMGYLSDRPDLFSGGGQADGQGTSFVSFNAGVEGNAITMTSALENRIGSILTQPNSTAADVAHAIAYYDETSGDDAWADGPPPATPADILEFNHTTYINTINDAINDVSQNYAHYASVVIGKGQVGTNNVPASELQFGGGGGGSTVTATAPSDGSDCSCSTDPSVAGAVTTPASTPNSGAPTIVLDPGHATTTNEDVDPATDLPVFDYSNPIEQQQVWDMATDLKTKLTAAGYNVLITKNSENDTDTNLKQRAEVGNNANAALAVSLHTTPGSPSVGNDVFIPLVGDYMVKVNGQRVTYTNQSLADTDKSDGQIMAQSLNQASSLNFKVGGYGQIFGTIVRQQDGLTMTGTMLTTQYFATVPWLYLERYQDSSTYGTTTQSGMNDYETGVLNGIEKIVPINGATPSTPADAGGDASDCSGGSSSSNASIIQVAKQELALGLVGTGPDNNYGPVCKYQGSACGEAWCADFVSWVYKTAGVPFKAGAPFTGTILDGWRIPLASDITTYFLEHKGQAGFGYGSQAGGDKMEPGWAVSFTGEDPGVRGIGHVGIITAVNADGTFDDIEGNGSGPGVSQNTNLPLSSAIDWGGYE